MKPIYGVFQKDLPNFEGPLSYHRTFRAARQSAKKRVIGTYFAVSFNGRRSWQKLEIVEAKSLLKIRK